MAVVIRLQGLSITAGSEDIRSFFRGLKIPDGGVHIIGGIREEAFIIFASDEDARRAMVRSGGCIKGCPVNLLLSSKSEMQSILEESTKNVELEQKTHRERSRHHDADVFGGARRAGHMQTAGRGQSDNSHGKAGQSLRSSSSNPICVLLTGMPFFVTENDVRNFFHGLSVDGIILGKNNRGQNNGEGFVKFATSQDARDGLMRDREYIGPRYVRIRPVTEEVWLEASNRLAGGENGNNKFRRGSSPTSSRSYPQDHTRSRSPLAPPNHSPRYSQTRTRSRSPLAMSTHRPSYPQTRTRSRSPVVPPTHSARQPQARTRSRSPLPPRSNSPSNEEFCVMLENLSHTVEKRDIKDFFRYRLDDDQILFLLDDQGRRTSSLFVLFNSLRDYCSALTRNNEKLNHKNVHISPISREKMMSILESHTGRSVQRGQVNDPEKACLYVRNMPFDVRKVEIIDFFEMGSLGFSITEDKVFLLRDHKGAGLGEALVVFESEEDAMSALHLDGQRFLGSVVMLKCISLSQMREFGVEPPAAQESMERKERHSSRKSDGHHYPGDTEVGNIRMPTDDLQVNRQSDSYSGRSYASQDGGNRINYGDFGPPSPQFEGPTCLKLVNLPLKIKMDEIYDFCYGYRVIPGSVTVLHDQNGMPNGSATVVFDSRQEALTAVKELSGRPIGARKIQLIFV